MYVEFEFIQCDELLDEEKYEIEEQELKIIEKLLTKANKKASNWGLFF